MKKNILQARKALLALFAMLMPLVASAHDFEVDGIYYNITSEADKQAEVTYQGDNCLDYNEYSGSITLPATVTHNGVAYSVTSIGNDAFDGCSNLTAITIPVSVTSIGEAAFGACSSLTAITIPENSQLTSIGYWAFIDCSSLTAITIPEGVTSIEEYTFFGCSNLTDITIPESVTSIGEGAFYGCSSLTAITIPEGVTSIGDWAFENCSSLERVTINCATVGDWFSGFSSIIEIVLGDGVTSIGDNAFSECNSLERVTINCATVGNWFSGFSSIKEVVLGDGVTNIVDRAFYDCRSLTSITIPEGVTSIGDRTFYGCSSLKTVINYSDLDIQKGSSSNGYVAYYADIAVNVDEFISDYAFKTTDGVHYLTGYVGNNTELTLPTDYQGNIYQIGDYAFYNCSSLTAINIPESVTSIGDYAFYGCSNLTAITIPASVTSIGEAAFGACSSLTAITIPVSVTSIGSSAFYDCSSLTAITIPEGVTSIGYSAFRNCRSLTAITIPESVTSIGRSAFYDCSSLERVTINCANVGDWFSRFSSIKQVVLGDGVTSIGKNAFYQCSNLKEVTLGSGIRTIGANAFSSCTVLEKVTIYATRPPSIEGTGNAFFSDATYENATLYVPQGCIDKYQVMTGWSSFYTIEEMEGGTTNYLTLRQADNGEVGIVVEPGRTYKVRITAFEGWKIHSVTFNDTDVTAQLTEEGTFTTPALSEDAVLNIAYEKIEDDTMVENARANHIKVQGHHGTLRITGTTRGAAISVYTTDGMLVAQESAEDSETELTLPTGQVYIVTVADKVVKIGL